MARLAGPVISPLVGVEFSSTVGRKVRLRELTAGAAREALTLFRMHEEQGFYRIVPVENAHYLEARRTLDTVAVPLSTLDALHLAVAQSAGSSVLTADKTMARAAGAVGVRAKLVAGGGTH